MNVLTISLFIIFWSLILFYIPLWIILVIFTPIKPIVPIKDSPPVEVAVNALILDVIIFLSYHLFMYFLHKIKKQ